MDSENENVIVLPRFGECTYKDSETLSFPWGLPGFAHLRKFLALQAAPADRFVWLQSLDDLSVAIPLADPWSIFDDYAPQLPQYARTVLELDDAQEFAVQCVVVVTKNAEEMTMNLLAPIVINLQTRVGRQVTLEGSAYSIRTPIPRKAAAGAPGADGGGVQEEAVQK